MSDPDLFDVVIFEKSSRKIYAVIGKGLRRYIGVGGGLNTADLRVQSGLAKINERFDCVMVPAGKFGSGDTMP